MKLGYEGTSVDDIAKRANVSKPTVYKHFTDKKSLFVAFVRLECASHADAVFRVDLQDRDIRKCLRSIARQYLELILSPFAQSIFRLAAAETKRFPEIGRVFYDSAIATGSRRLSQLLSGAVARGDFMIDDVDLAAHQFWSCAKRTFSIERFSGSIRSSMTPTKIVRRISQSRPSSRYMETTTILADRNRL